MSKEMHISLVINALQYDARYTQRQNRDLIKMVNQ